MIFFPDGISLQCLVNSIGVNGFCALSFLLERIMYFVALIGVNGACVPQPLTERIVFVLRRFYWSEWNVCLDALLKKMEAVFRSFYWSKRIQYFVTYIGVNCFCALAFLLMRINKNLRKMKRKMETARFSQHRGGLTINNCYILNRI